MLRDPETRAAAAPLADLLAALPPEWPEDPAADLGSAVREAGAKVVVLDDDPTGTQTVHGVPVLTEWSEEALRAELADALPAVYLLTNSRSLPPAEAEALNAATGRAIAAASRASGRRFAVVSRSDSTLRGHFPGEVDALAAALGGGFDTTLLIPAFIAGGRYTIGDVHYAADGDRLVPAGETEFARDAAFGYRSSNLRQWVEEKTRGRIPAAAVASIGIETLRRGGPREVAVRLCGLTRGCVCVINAASERDLAVATLGVLRAEAQGRRFLYRTAASFVPLRAGIAPRAPLARADLALPESGGGLVVVGSYVPRTSGQLAALLEGRSMKRVELDIEALLSDGRGPDEIGRAAREAEQALRRGEDTAVWTSRRLVTGGDAAKSLRIGRRVSDGLTAVVRALAVRPRYVLAKGGITSSDVATKGLGVKRAMVLGQILPGVPVWRLGPESRWPDLAYIVFPGNVGGPDALRAVVEGLA